MTSLGIFVKHPVAGQVKTRLAEFLGTKQATEVYAAFVADLVERFRDVANQRFLCYAPAEDSAKSCFLNHAKETYCLWPQPDKDLGERMAQFFLEHLRAEQDRVVIIGSDSPTLPREYVERAFELLQSADCVLGPATDGGYYLIGARGTCPPIFEEIAWSTSEVLAQTIALIDKFGLSLSLLPPWYDVDTMDDWNFLAAHIRGLIRAGSEINLEHVCRVLGVDTVSGRQTL